MRLRRQHLITACLAVLAFHAAAAQGAPSDSAIRHWLRERVDNGYANGIVVGILDGDKRRIVAYGGADKSGRAHDGNTLFEIGSITKVFTNILLADMVQRGEVSLDDTVSRYLPAEVKVPSRNGKVITLLDLATASSGLPRNADNMKPADAAKWGAKELESVRKEHISLVI